MPMKPAPEHTDRPTARQQSLFLTKKEVVALTGYTQPKRQVEQLLRMRLPFHIKRGGHPVIARSIFESESKRDVAASIAKTQAKPWWPKWVG